MEKPYITLVSEVTVDGKVTLGKGISSILLMKGMDQESKFFLHQLRADYDAIMVGSTTIKIDNSNLTVRHVEGKSPLRVIPCSKGDLPLDSNIFNQEAPTIICVSNKASQETITAMKEKGVEVVKFDQDGQVDLKALVNYLAKEKGVKKMILEGGPTLNYQMLKEKLVNKFIIITMPLIVGGDATPSLVAGTPAKSLEETLKLKFLKMERCGRHPVMEYEVEYN